MKGVYVSLGCGAANFSDTMRILLCVVVSEFVIFMMFILFIMEKKHILLGATTIIALGAGFFGGVTYEKQSIATYSSEQGVSMRGGAGNRAAGFGGTGVRTGGGARGAGSAGDGFSIGKILSHDNKSITIRTSDGGSKIVYFSDTTSISKSASTVSTDLSVGERVRVNGKSSPDGTISAENIDILPQGAAPDRPTTN